MVKLPAISLQPCKWKGATRFNGGGGCFSDGGASFLSGGALHGGASILVGGGVRNKSLDGGVPPLPHYGKSWIPTFWVELSDMILEQAKMAEE